MEVRFLFEHAAGREIRVETVGRMVSNICILYNGHIWLFMALCWKDVSNLLIYGYGSKLENPIAGWFSY